VVGRKTEYFNHSKEGAAYIAIHAGVPIVPVVLIGARAALPMGAGVVISADVVLRILRPIETAQLTLKERGTVTGLLRSLNSGSPKPLAAQTDCVWRQDDCYSKEMREDPSGCPGSRAS
jgi:hypothetical protein